MSSRGPLVLVFLIAPLAFAHNASEATGVPVVTVKPACPELLNVRGQPSKPPHIVIRYNTNPPGARLTSAQAITLFLADVRPNPSETRPMPLTQGPGGTWETEFDAKPFTLLMFFFKDQQNRVDNNNGEYWDIPICRDGEPFSMAISERASTYEGRLIAPGIQRAPDLARAIQILKEALEHRPGNYLLYYPLWQDELKAGGRSPSAYEQVSRRVDEFITANGTVPMALRQISGFVGVEQQKLAGGVVARYRQAVMDLPQTAKPPQERAPRPEIFRRAVQRDVSEILAELDYWPASWEQGPGKQAEALLAFAGKHPETMRTGIAYSQAFLDEKQINNVAGLERVFGQWIAYDPENVDPLVAMAHFYVDRKIKLDRAIQLLDAAAALSTKGPTGPPKTLMFLEYTPGGGGYSAKIELLRGQANLLLNNLSAARSDLEAAAKAMPDNSEALDALGEVREKMGANAEALDAYLAAASAPYQDSSAPRDAYERLFAALKLGSKDEADQKLFARIAVIARSAAAQYSPVPMDRAAPQFTFIDLAGNTFDNQAARGKPSVLSFWSVGCAPCLPELTAFQDFQNRHREVNLMTVAISNQPEDVKAVLTSRKLNTLHVAITKDWQQALGVNQVPTTIVMDRLGRIQFVHVGQLSDVAAILQKDLDALGAPN